MLLEIWLHEVLLHFLICIGKVVSIERMIEWLTGRVVE